MFENINEYTTLAKKAKFIRGVTYPKSAEAHEVTDYKILTSDNVTLEGEFELNKVVYLKNGTTLQPEKKLLKNDILICLSSGSKNHVGKNALIPMEGNYYAGGFMGIIRADKISPITLHYLLNTEEAKQFYLNTSNGTNIQNLSNNIENMKIKDVSKSDEKKLLDGIEEIDKLKFCEL